MSNRKLQSEIDRTLKKISEGVDEFEAIWQKVHSTDKPNLKEKYENDLKKEIKKLQRYREQVKSWACSSDIKNKQPLLDARRRIEQDMERFKIAEKEAKTKAYSKEALEKHKEVKVEEDPEIVETKEWIEDMKQALLDKVNSREKEYEKFGTSAKKRGKKGFDKEKYENLREHIDRLNWHITKLDSTQEKLESYDIAIDSIEYVKEDIEYYIEAVTAPTFDFQEDFIEDSYFYSMLEEDLNVDEPELKETTEPEETPNKNKKQTTGSSKGSFEDEDILPMQISSNLVGPAKHTNEKSSKKSVKVKSKQINVPSAVKSTPVKVSNAAFGKNILPTPIKPIVPKTESQFASIVKNQSNSRNSNLSSLGSEDIKVPAPVAPQGKKNPASAVSHDFIPPGRIHKPKTGDISQILSRNPNSYELPYLPKKPAYKIPKRFNDALNSEHKWCLDMLDNSLNTFPSQGDPQKANSYIPRNPYGTPECFPSIPAPIFDNNQVFSRFETDTLFFIFYFQQGTYHQYLAAKQLKKQSWRYHKKYLTWFMRFDDPKLSTDDFEKGTYVYFDYDYSWCQRIKTDFTFEYNYLEDELDV